MTVASKGLIDGVNGNSGGNVQNGFNQSGEYTGLNLFNGIVINKLLKYRQE